MIARGRRSPRLNGDGAEADDLDWMEVIGSSSFVAGAAPDSDQAMAARTSGSASVWLSVALVRAMMASISASVQQSGGA